jgi:multiple sugar transport system substrate-binding protein
LFEDTLFADYFRNNPKMIPFAKQAKYVKGTDPCPVLKEVFDIISREYEACVIYNVKSPEQAIKDAALAVQLLLM